MKRHSGLPNFNENTSISIRALLIHTNIKKFSFYLI